MVLSTFAHDGESDINRAATGLDLFPGTTFEIRVFREGISRFTRFSIIFPGIREIRAIRDQILQRHFCFPHFSVFVNTSFRLIL